ncbi:MAG: hypothetical protein C4537_07790 [Acholeplasma sp.]|nr:MAG: hypothetical protein C4537_07790 [Acholeplasma sp.]
MKKNIALNAVEFASKILDLSEIEVVFKPAMAFHNPEINALFNGQYYSITFNEDWLCHAKYEEIILTALHETRHAYQKAVIEFPDLMNSHVKPEIVKQWKMDFEAYKKPYESSVYDYQSQSIEIDAIAFTYLAMVSFFSIKPIIPETIYEQVMDRCKEINLKRFER